MPAPSGPPASMANPSARSCFSECPVGVENSHCISAGAAPPAYASAFAQLTATLVKQTNVRVEPASLMPNLRLAPNAASRGSILLQGDRLTNAGSPMRLEGSAPALAATAVLELPANVDATVERHGAVTIFRLPPTSPHVSIRLLNAANRAPHRLDATAAGRVLAVEVNGPTVFVQTASACLSTTLPSEAPSKTPSMH